MYTITQIEHENPQLNQVIIKNAALNLHSIIYPNLGASLQKLTINNTEIIDGISNNEAGLEMYKTRYNSSLLFPFPNRISDGKYEINGTSYQINCNEKALNNALHGFVFNKYFSVTKINSTSTEASITFSYSDTKKTAYPFDYQLDVTYIFSENKLNIGFIVTNKSTKTMPFGIGWHPYFKAKNLHKSILNFEAENQFALNEKMIPLHEVPLKINTPTEMDAIFLDDCFVTQKSETTFKTDAYSIEMKFSSKPPNSFLQVYTPPTRDCIAIEPMTCAPNSFNNKKGLLLLEPEKNYVWTVEMDYVIL